MIVIARINNQNIKASYISRNKVSKIKNRVNHSFVLKIIVFLEYGKNKHKINKNSVRCNSTYLGYLEWKK